MKMKWLQHLSPAGMSVLKFSVKLNEM